MSWDSVCEQVMPTMNGPSSSGASRLRQRVLRHVFSLLVGFLLLQVAGEAWAQFEPPPLPSGQVVEIRIEGTERVEPNAVRNIVGTRIGQPLERSQIRRDILAIRRLQTGNTPYFEDVQVDVEAVEGGVVITFIVEERPIIASFRYSFTHDSELEDDLEDVVDLEVGDIFDLSRIRDNVRKIEELYREKGYYLAEADFQWVERDDGDIDLTIVISEYEEVEVRRVTFVGNENISDADLQSVMATRPGSILGFLTDAGVFEETAFSDDRRRLLGFYYDQGFIDVEVGQPQVELSRDLTEIFITIPIGEGEQYSLSDINVGGDFLIPPEEIMDRFVIAEPGEVFSSTALRADMERINAYYKEQGYANALVNLGTRRDPENLEVGVTYDIQQGELVYIGRITIVGNSTTRDAVIRREMRILESDLYNGTALRVSRARIERLGFFESVQIREIATANPTIMDLEVEVAERATGQFQVGAGFSSVESFIFTATVSQNNLFGRGQALQLQASLSALRTIFSLGLTEPYLFGTQWQFGFEIFNREILFTDFTRTSLGFSLTLGHPITDDVIVSGTYQLEDVDVEAGGRSGRSDRQFSNLFIGGRTSSMTGTILWDTRNNRLFPSSGFFQRGSLELADEIFISENEFLRLKVVSRWYTELLDDVVLKFNADLGFVATTDSEKPVPIFERFFIGGPNSVRGFERATLSPTEPAAGDPNDPGSNLVGFPVGGNKSLFFNLEIEFPILTAIGVRGVLFADAGNAFGDDQPYSLQLDVFSDDATNYTDVLRSSVGFGFRWFSPIGPLRFEWGFPLSPLPNEDTSVFEFSIGNFL